MCGPTKIVATARYWPQERSRPSHPVAQAVNHAAISMIGYLHQILPRGYAPHPLHIQAGKCFVFSRSIWVACTAWKLMMLKFKNLQRSIVCRPVTHVKSLTRDQPQRRLFYRASIHMVDTSLRPAATHVRFDKLRT